MSLDLIIAWFLTFFPITISPGPANILLSSTSAQYGTRQTLPLMWGIVFVFSLQIAAVGFGIGELLFRFPALFEIFKVIGSLYLFYLAYQFFRMSGDIGKAQDTKIGFREGALLQFFNFKALSVPLIMYTQFLNPLTATRSQVIGLTLALFVLIIVSLLTWVVAGSFLQGAFQSEFGRKWQGKIFGAVLAAVALWVMLR